jgi:hypothetical protein
MPAGPTHASRSTVQSGYVAAGEGAVWLVEDEGAMADFLDADEAAGLLAGLVSLERYTRRRSARRRSRDAPAPLRSRMGRLRPPCLPSPKTPWARPSGSTRPRRSCRVRA